MMWVARDPDRGLPTRERPLATMRGTAGGTGPQVGQSAEAGDDGLSAAHHVFGTDLDLGRP